MGRAPAGRRRRCSTGPTPSASPASSTAWSCWTRRARWSGPRCCGTTCARPTPPPSSIAGRGGPGWWASHVGSVPDALVHRHQAALAGRARAGQRRPGPRRAAAARLADRPLRGGRPYPAPPTWSPTAATRPAPATSPRRRATGCPTWPLPPSATGRACRGWPGPPRSSAGRPGARRCPPVPATTWAPPSAWAWSPASWPCPSAPRARRSRSAPSPADDASGAVAGFADATGQLPAPGLHDQRGPGAGRPRPRCSAPTWPGWTALALAAEPGAGGLTLLPYLDGERTPDRPLGHRRAARPDHPQREPGRTWPGPRSRRVLASLADAADLIAGYGVELRPGAAHRRRRVGRPPSASWRRASSAADVEVPEPEEYVALGAARQAAWALTGDDAPPSWPRRTAAVYSGAPSREIRERHAALRDDTSARRWGVRVAPRVGTCLEGRNTPVTADRLRPHPRGPLLVRHLDRRLAGRRRVRRRHPAATCPPSGP